MYVKIETEDFKELYTFQKCKFIPRIGELENTLGVKKEPLKLLE